MRALAVCSLLGLLLVASAPSSAKTFKVKPGDSIQAAVDQAGPGDKVMVAPGTYHETGSPCPTDASHTCSVVVTKDDIKLVAQSSKSKSVIIENPGGHDQGIAIARAGAAGPGCLTDQSHRVQGALVQGFTVNGFGGEGIFLFCVDDWKVQKNAANDNDEYGIFPSHCGAGKVSHNTATGSNDTGIYIGQSHDVRVDHNLATGNVSGFEIENSSNVRLDHNEATANTGGILSFTLPGLDVTSNHDNRIDHNDSHDNNKTNTCSDPNDEVCQVPKGTGMLILAADANGVDHNTVTGNGTGGIALVSGCLNVDCSQPFPPGYDPTPDDDQIEHNKVTGNGNDPDPNYAFLAADLINLPEGTGNAPPSHGDCWDKNTFGTQFGIALTPCE